MKPDDFTGLPPRDARRFRMAVRGFELGLVSRRRAEAAIAAAARLRLRVGAR